MMQTRIYAEQLAIQHVRQGGDGMPVGGVKMSEGPCEVGKAQPAGHATGTINVIVIIVTDPTEVRGLPEDDPDQRSKREDHQNFCVFKLKRRLYTGAGSANQPSSRRGMG